MFDPLSPLNAYTVLLRQRLYYYYPAYSLTNDCAVTPTIYQTTDRRALRLTTIITATSTVLLPEQTPTAPACSISNSTLAVLPAAPQSTSTAPARSITTDPYCYTYS